MFADQQLALSNLRYLTKGGQTTEFYDLLTERLSQLAGCWESLPLDDDEKRILGAYKVRLQIELTYLRQLSVLDH